jgi:predicted PurR-regulated permease PerM
MTKNRGTSPLFTLAAIVTTIAALFFAKEILLPLALAILLSFLLTPLANTLERWRVPRVPAAILVVAMSFAVLCALGWVVTIQLIDLSRELPNHRENLFAKVRSIRPDSQAITKLSETVEGLGKELTGGDEPKDEQSQAASQNGRPDSESREQPNQQESTDDNQPRTALAGDGSPADAVLPLNVAADGEEATQAVELRVVEMPPSPLAQIQSWLGVLAAPLTTIGMVIVMVFFILLDRENQRNRLIQLFGRSNLHRTTEAIHDAGRRIGRYLRMQFLINAGYGLTVALGLWLIGVRGAVMWGVLGFSLRFLPYVGPWIAAILPIVVSVATSPGWTQPLFVVGLYVVLELLLNNVAEPLLYGGSTGVSTVGVILAAIFWTWLWGPIGLVLAMPITVCLVVTARYVPQLRFITVLLADQPMLTPSERLYQRLLAFDYNEPLRIARKHLKSSSLTSFYDDLLIPALVHAENDRHAGVLNDDQEEFVHEAAADLVEDLAEDASKTSELNVQPDASAAVKLTSNADASQSTSFTQVRILCVPLRDQADAAAGQMLAQLLATDGFQVHVDAAESLSGEVVDHVAKLASELVVISILPPIAPRDSRLLWKRLRYRYPNLPIIVGYWNHAQSTEPLDPPEGDAQTKIATTLAEAVAMVRSTAAQLQATGQEPPREVQSAAG